MAFRHGFKTEANETAREIRKELKLPAADALDPWKLAQYLEIPVMPLSAFSDSASRGVEYFTHGDQSAFSAVTVFSGSRRIIVHNDSHHPVRQASNLAHELSHGLLLHPPTPALDDRGCRDWDPDVESEADWLAGALLVTEEAALRIVRLGLSIPVAAAQYGVSEPMMRFRLNVTGAYKRVQRARQSYRR